MKILEWLTSFIAWLQIVAFPLLIGLVARFLIYVNYPPTAGIITGISIAVLGLVAGIILATKIWKQHGTVDFISNISATPELDNLDQEKNNEVCFQNKQHLQLPHKKSAPGLAERF